MRIGISWIRVYEQKKKQIFRRYFLYTFCQLSISQTINIKFMTHTNKHAPKCVYWQTPTFSPEKTES